MVVPNLAMLATSFYIVALVAPTSSAYGPRRPRAPPPLSASAPGSRGGGARGDSTPVAASTPPAAPPTASATSVPDSYPPREPESPLARARCLLGDGDAGGAFAALVRARDLDPSSPEVAATFEACLRLKVELAEGKYYAWRDGLDLPSRCGITNDDLVVVASEGELNELFQDRMGLASLFIDGERYDEAGAQLRKAIEETMFWLNRSLQSPHNEGAGKTTAGHNGRPPVLNFSSTRFGHWKQQIDRARYLLYRTNAACCRWDTYFDDGDRLRRSLMSGMSSLGQVLRLLHPFDALKFPCVSLGLASDIARGYAHRAIESAGAEVAHQNARQDSVGRHSTRRAVFATTEDVSHLQRKVRIGYVSPDFTTRHPLAFLMQHVFRFHDKSRFVVNIYSISSSANDDGPEVRAIRESSDRFVHLTPSSMSALEIYQRFVRDELDIVVDLCGYAGTSLMSEIMASRCQLPRDQEQGRSARPFPVHVSYMGFPGSVGSSRVWDYSVFDKITVPPEERFGIRKHYDEALVYMPHCYFVNSHKTVIGGSRDGIALANEDERKALRAQYGIHPSAFVYCCHSRPDKIDPVTFRSWMRALLRVRSKGSLKAGSTVPVLWLLRSGHEIETNLCQWVWQEFREDAEDCLVFADVVGRNDHLRRLGIADVFLDTPAYNAHTLGCDALYAGVPMISLLRPLEKADGGVIDSELDSKYGDVWPADADLDDVDLCVDPGLGRETRSIATEKVASRVGASLLGAVGLEDLVCEDMTDYEDVIVRCALDKQWFDGVRQRLLSARDISPLFDTGRWVRNLEKAFYKMTKIDMEGDGLPDIFVSDDSTRSE